MILITGATGSIGQRVKFDRELNFRLPLDLLRVNLPTKDTNGSTLIHLAGISSPKEVAQDLRLSHEVNVRSTIDLFRLFAMNGGKRFIFISSGHVYGLTREDSRSSEEDKLNPQSKYAEQKIETETLLTQCKENFTTELLILRVFSVFGAGMRRNYLAGMVEHSVQELNVNPLILTSDDIRDFSTPGEVGKMIDNSTNIEIGKVKIINICSGTPMSVKQRVQKDYPDIPPSHYLSGYSRVPRLVGDPTRLKGLSLEG